MLQQGTGCISLAGSSVLIVGLQGTTSFRRCLTAPGWMVKLHCQNAPSAMENFELKTFARAAELAADAARDWLALLGKSSAGHLAAISGGRIAGTFFCAVAQGAERERVSFQGVDFFWADERCVPPEHPDSNYILARENLLQPLGIADDKIHRVKGELSPSAAVSEASAALARIGPKNSDGLPILDMIFLGLGEDGHVASLMPNIPESAVRTRAIYLHIENSPKPPSDRISLSYAVIAAAKNVWLLASGAGKEEALRQSLRPGARTPCGRVLQSRSHTVIYSDLAL
jgi:6-phosphogluconolactonase